MLFLEDRIKGKNNAYKFYGTDEELEEALPILGIVALIAIIGLGIFFIL